jgi:hypothetical protein
MVGPYSLETLMASVYCLINDWGPALATANLHENPDLNIIAPTASSRCSSLVQ